MYFLMSKLFTNAQKYNLILFFKMFLFLSIKWCPGFLKEHFHLL